MTYSFPFERILDLEFFLAYRRVAYGIPVEVEAFDMESNLVGSVPSQALHGLAPKCKLINMHELINKSTNDYVTLLPCENGANVNNKG